jgi:large subunit ribosomal protein L23
MRTISKRHSYQIILHPFVAEKSLTLMDRENKLQFIVKRDATKEEIKRSIEDIYDVRVEAVNTMITKHGKKATVKLKPEYSAEELGMRIGIF